MALRERLIKETIPGANPVGQDSAQKFQEMKARLHRVLITGWI
jgi:hypothetical protein